MAILSPKIICLDSSTWGRLAKDWANNRDASSVVEILNSGALIPYFTWHHIEEIIQHGDDVVYTKRVSLIDSLRFVAFPKLPEEVGNIGSLMDLRHLEILEILRAPTLSLDQIIDSVRPKITDGSCSGHDLCLANRPWWDFYRTNCSVERQAHKARIASLAQFPFGDQKEKISPSLGRSRLRSASDAEAEFRKMATSLTARIQKDGDSRLDDAARVAHEFMKEAYEDGQSLYEMEGDEFERLLRHNKVDPTRLPANATMRDMGDESHFCKLLELHEEWLKMPLGTLYPSIRQESVPSWIVWREVDRVLKSSPKANASNVNDLSIVSFGLYVDAIECDKRVREFVRQAAGKHPLLAAVEGRLMKWKDYADLTHQLERIAAM